MYLGEVYEGQIRVRRNSLWEQLPEDLQVQILAWLPIDFKQRYSIVNRQWNAILSSNYFITRLWSNAPTNKKPLLALTVANPRQPCIAFCFYSRAWKPYFSLSFIPESPHLAPHEITGDVLCRGSAAGLVLLDYTITDHRDQDNPCNSANVCNPYTATSVKLPGMSVISKLIDRCIVVGNNNSDKIDDSYRVVALGWWGPGGYPLHQLVEFYDSSERVWKVAGSLLETIKLPDRHYGRPYVTPRHLFYCNGSFYFVGKRLHDLVTGMGVVSFTIPKDSTAETSLSLLIAPFPSFLDSAFWRFIFWEHLVTCGSRLLLAVEVDVAYEQAMGKLVVQMMILEFQRDEPTSDSSAWTWKKIATMPPSVFYQLKTRIWATPWCLTCIGVGDYVCFMGDNMPITERETNVVRRRKDIDDILVYNLVDGSWTWLPATPSWFSLRNSTASKFAFEPNLHTIVE